MHRLDRRLLLALFCLGACSSPARVCEPGATQACVCPGAASGAQACADDGQRWEACRCDAPATPPPPPPPPTSAPPPSAEPPSSAPAAAIGAAAVAAMDAYRAAIAAYDARDVEGYFGAFADPLACFHGTRDQPLRALRESRAPAISDEGLGALAIVDLSVLSAGDDEVVLLDRGAYWSQVPGPHGGGHPYLQMSSDAIEMGLHEKIVFMRRIGGAWRIAIETDRRHLDCVGAPDAVASLTSALAAEAELPPALAACRTANESCLRGCDATCAECEGGCNGCNLCPDGCVNALADCIGADAAFRGPFAE